jgi:hypothetical protein
MPTDDEAGLPGRDLKTLMDDYERGLIMAALGAADGQQARAAALLRVLPTTLHEKIKRLGLHRTFGDPPAPGSREVVLGEDGRAFTWRGPLPPGSTVELRGTIGDVRVHAADVELAEVRALPAVRSAEARITVNVLEHDRGLSVSAQHQKLPSSDDTPGARDRAASLLVRLRVEFDLRVPLLTHLDVRLFAGDITVLGVTGHVQAHTSSGTVRIG